jgi:hypothetical protein
VFILAPWLFLAVSDWSETVWQSLRTRAGDIGGAGLLFERTG